MRCINRLNQYESNTLARTSLAYPEVRAAQRDWFYARWRYLLAEYEKVPPHIDGVTAAVAALKGIRFVADAF